jgi:hypothetical protein
VHPVTGVPLSKKVTAPVALDGVTVATRVTWPTGGVGLGLTESAVAVVDALAAPITMFAAGLVDVESCDVATLNVVFWYVPAAGFVMPAIENEPDAELASEHPAGSTTVATLPWMGNLHRIQ